MKHQLQTIRAGLETATCYTMLGVDAHSVQTALTALTQLEAMVGEPVADINVRPSESGGTIASVFSHKLPVGSWLLYRAAPVAQQPQCRDLSDADMDKIATWIGDQERGDIGFQGLCDRIIRAFSTPVAQQPQARPDFNDEWTGYLKDGETPFERFLRERKDVQSALKLYQRALEENERLKAQQPQAEAVPQDVGRLEYRGNSVAYIHQKMTAYRGAIDAAWQAMRDAGHPPDGCTPLAQAITKALATQQAEAVPCGSREYCGRFPFCGCGNSDSLPERDTTKPAEQQGLFRKFVVRRTDGSDAPGGKHDGCDYFVLDVTHDKHAKAALAAYAASVEETHPQLATDMRDRYGLAAPQQAEAVPPIYYMRDNHTFKRLSENVETALIEIEQEFNAGWTHGTLCSRRKGFDPVHASGSDSRLQFFAKCKDALAAAIAQQKGQP